MNFKNIKRNLLIAGVGAFLASCASTYKISDTQATKSSAPRTEVSNQASISSPRILANESVVNNYKSASNPVNTFDANSYIASKDSDIISSKPMIVSAYMSKEDEKVAFVENFPGTNQDLVEPGVSYHKKVENDPTKIARATTYLVVASDTISNDEFDKNLALYETRQPKINYDLNCDDCEDKKTNIIPQHNEVTIIGDDSFEKENKLYFGIAPEFRFMDGNSTALKFKGGIFLNDNFALGLSYATPSLDLSIPKLNIDLKNTFDVKDGSYDASFSELNGLKTKKYVTPVNISDYISSKPLSSFGLEAIADLGLVDFRLGADLQLESLKRDIAYNQKITEIYGFEDGKLLGKEDESELAPQKMSQLAKVAYLGPSVGLGLDLGNFNFHLDYSVGFPMKKSTTFDSVTFGKDNVQSDNPRANYKVPSQKVKHAPISKWTFGVNYKIKW